MNRTLLEKPFESAHVKQRQGTFGNTLDYVEGHAVVARLNEAFESNWTFELSNHWKRSSAIRGIIPGIDWVRHPRDWNHMGLRRDPLLDRQQ